MSGIPKANELCIAAHSPQTLERIVASHIAKFLIYNSIPSAISLSVKPTKYDDYWSCTKLDKIILASTENELYHNLLKNQIILMKSWWEDTTWFGSVGSPLRNIVQESVSYLLDQMDYYFHCPLFKLTCQLCYTKNAGNFNNIDNHLTATVPKRSCDQYALYLECLGAFQIEHFQTMAMVFGNPNPVVVILKKAPFLKSLHLKYNCCDYVLSCVGKYCSGIKRFVIEDACGKLCISETYLYKTFFTGCQKHEVLNNKIREISFPNLEELDVGHGKIAQEFLCAIGSYHSHLRSLSCNSPNHYAIELLSTAKAFNLAAFNIRDICMSSECLLAVREEEVIKYFPNIKHLTISLGIVPRSQVVIIKERVKAFLTLFPTSITINLPYSSICDEDLHRMLVPLFILIGPKVRALQFLFLRKTDLIIIWKLVNSCPNLQLLGIRLCEEPLVHNLIHKKHLNFITLNHLTSFSLIINRCGDTIPEFLTIIEQLLIKAPFLSALELILPSVSCDWVVSVAANNLLQRVTTLVLQFHSEGIDNIKVWVTIIDFLTSLEELIILGAVPSMLEYLISKYKTTRLRIMPRKLKTLIAYYGFYSKYKIGGYSSWTT